MISAKDWVVDSGATRHICENRTAFISFTPTHEGEEYVLMGDSRHSLVAGKGKLLLKLPLVKLSHSVMCFLF